MKACELLGQTRDVSPGGITLVCLWGSKETGYFCATKTGWDRPTPTLETILGFLAALLDSH